MFESLNYISSELYNRLKLIDPTMNKIDFAIIYDVANGNPNGNFDANNRPNTYPCNGKGFVTDTSFKYKIRRTIEAINALLYGDDTGKKIYVSPGPILNNKDFEAIAEQGIDISKNIKDEIKEKQKENPDIEKEIFKYMLENYYDIRTFGGIMTGLSKSGLKESNIQGPVQITCGTSVDPVNIIDVTVTRCCIANKEDEDKKTTIGNKFIIPYALYTTKGHISPMLARKSGFSKDDLELLWQAIITMFEQNRSATKGEMSIRELIIFKHDSPLGNAPTHKLFDTIHIEKNTETPEKFSDYTITIDEMPQGVELIRIR